jgi:hypothetical protein
MKKLCVLFLALLLISGRGGDWRNKVDAILLERASAGGTV